MVTADFEITIRYDHFRADTEKLMRIIREMDGFKASAINEDEAVRQAKEELRRRLIAAGLSK